MAILALLSSAYFSAQLMNHELQPVADTQHRDAELEYTRISRRSVRVVNRARATGENDA